MNKALRLEHFAHHGLREFGIHLNRSIRIPHRFSISIPNDEDGGHTLDFTCEDHLSSREHCWDSNDGDPFSGSQFEPAAINKLPRTDLYFHHVGACLQWEIHEPFDYASF